MVAFCVCVCVLIDCIYVNNYVVLKKEAKATDKKHSEYFVPKSKKNDEKIRWKNISNSKWIHYNRFCFY